MIDLTKHPGDNRTLRPVYRVIGLVVLFVSILWLLFERGWEPLIVGLLSRSDVGRQLVAYVPYTPLFLIAIGGYFINKSREKSLYPSKDQVDNGKY